MLPDYTVIYIRGMFKNINKSISCSKLPKFGEKICIEDMHTKRIRYQNLAEDENVANNNQPQESDAHCICSCL